MVRYYLAALAKTDLTSIHAHISTDSVEAADRVLASPYDAFELLGTSPELGTLRPDYQPANLRVFAARRYVIAYRFKNNAVEILRVLHGARDIDAMMG